MPKKQLISCYLAEIKYDKKRGEHVTKVSPVKNYSDRIKKLKEFNKLNRTFDLKNNEKNN